MKKTTFKYKIDMRFLLIVLILPYFSNMATAQDGPQRVYMYLDYFKTDDGKYLQAELKYRDEGFKQLSNVEVIFTMSADTSTVELGKRTTSVGGLARVDLSNSEILRDTNGITLFKASFVGNDSYKRASKDLEMGDLHITMLAEEVDSMYQLKISASRLAGGKQVKVEDVDIQILTKRLFGLMPIEEVSTDENGQAEYVFPNDIPGNMLGNLWVIAMTDDDDDYGTVRTQQELPWGIPVYYNGNDKPRELWSKSAPLWIIFTVMALFAVLWYQYIRAISQLFKIKKL